MAYECVIDGQIYVFEAQYGEELETSRIIVRCAAGGPEGLFLVQRDGALEPADDLPGFGPNPVAVDGVWPLPPAQAIDDARRMAERKGLDAST
ncbi:hypothetical protein [uncultured Thiodictyon sp.]|uniref:hypothetical protein n=1 Tax=uncultured Thiodictyon sp. TaxID=1846217 RepID=UPI0026001D3F|nr:hypothetical protein [uncultured Thiodictyon sp.]